MKNKQIEGFRGIAIMLIVCFHLFCRFQQLYCNNSIGWMSWWGDFGAMSFLFISAFFLTNRTEKLKIKDYLIRKIIRLWPTYFICITIIFITLHIWWLPNRTCTFIDYVANVFWINGYIGVPYVEQSHWYLTTLISFILGVAFLKRIKKDQQPESYIVWCILAFIAKIVSNDFLYKLIGGSYVGVMGLAYVSHIFLEKKDSKEKYLIIRAMILLSLSSIYIYATKGIMYVVYLVIIMVIFSFAYYNKLKILEIKILQYLGAISYPLYLIHQNIAFCIEYQILQKSNTFTVKSGIIALLIVFAISIVVFNLNNIITSGLVHLRKKVRQ
ncbi:MAG: acyltransferase [Coprococcus sp.]|nr:acyltransferase [Coprococcus sp.]